MKLRMLGLVAAFAFAASSAQAVDVTSKNGPSHGQIGHDRTGYYCDEGWLDNAYFQAQNVAYGNQFSFGAGGELSWIDYWHFGWFTLVGPYTYAIELWDTSTCTQYTSIQGLSAADAFDTDQQEFEELCAYDVQVSGNLFVGIDGQSCFAANDCYPDVYFDQTGFVDGCDWIIDLLAPSCLNNFNGDFVLGVGVDECEPVPTDEQSWGSVKSRFAR